MQHADQPLGSLDSDRNESKRRSSFKPIMKTNCIKGLIEDFPDLQAVIPKQYSYHVCESQPNENGFKSTLRLPFLTKQECLQWKTELESLTFSTFRVHKTFPKCKHKINYKIVYRCQHSNVHKKKDSKKGTDCKAMLEFTIKRVYTQSKTKDFHLPSLPCVVKLYWTHNHDFCSTEMLKFRDVSDSTREELLALLRQGHIAPSALKELKARLKVKLGADYEKAALDRRFVPDIGFVKRLQKEIYGRGYKQSPHDFFNDLQKLIKKHVRKHASSAAVKKTDKGHIVAAIATDFMKRVCYQLKESGDVMLIKTTGDKNRYGCHVYLLLTLCCAGSLPVGCLMTTSDTTSTIVEAFQLYKSLLNNEAFYGQGYPVVIMAADASSESEAAGLAFPKSTHLLSTYHVLEAAWKWFFGHRKCQVQKKKLPYMFSLLKRMLVSTSVDEIDHFEKILSSEYPSIMTYVAYLYAKKELWGLCFRSGYHQYSNSLYNYVDFEMGALNERILSGINNFNVVELFNLVLSKVEKHYRAKLSGESNGEDHSNAETVMPVPLSDISRVEEKIFIVKCQFSSLRHFVVNTDLKACTCFAGFNGGSCEHQVAVQNYFPDSSNHLARFTCLTTEKHIQDSWFNFLQLEEVAKSYEVMEAFTAATNDLDERDNSSDSENSDHPQADNNDAYMNGSHTKPERVFYNAKRNSNDAVSEDCEDIFSVSGRDISSKTDHESDRINTELMETNQQVETHRAERVEHEYEYDNISNYWEDDDMDDIKPNVKLFTAEEAKDKLREAWKMLESRIDEKPDFFVSPIGDFVTQLLTPRSDRQLVSTLYSFGQGNS